MLNQQLLRAINGGRCFVLIGSGPSCEIDYPSWKCLANKVFMAVKGLNKASDEESYVKYLGEQKYPELFQLAERDLGGRATLTPLLKTLLGTCSQKTGYIYERLTKWPFSCYLTTNYDDEIKKHLERIGIHFAVLGNKKDDICVIREGIGNIILKLHSDLENPNDTIITSADYERFYVLDEGQYFRDKLRQIFEFFDQYCPVIS
ncbi:MAG: SIR2 family protein [Planctomycetaceae bacterium]|nr:SIR2 family protein [Planctomycetaceae bacterium]